MVVLAAQMLNKQPRNNAEVATLEAVNACHVATIRLKSNIENSNVIPQINRALQETLTNTITNLMTLTATCMATPQELIKRQASGFPLKELRVGILSRRWKNLGIKERQTNPAVGQCSIGFRSWDEIREEDERAVIYKCGYNTCGILLCSACMYDVFTRRGNCPFCYKTTKLPVYCVTEILTRRSFITWYTKGGYYDKDIIAGLKGQISAVIQHGQDMRCENALSTNRLQWSAVKIIGALRSLKMTYGAQMATLTGIWKIMTFQVLTPLLDEKLKMWYNSGYGRCRLPERNVNLIPLEELPSHAPAYTIHAYVLQPVSYKRQADGTIQNLFGMQVKIQLSQGQVISTIIEYIYHVSRDAGVAVKVNGRQDHSAQKTGKKHDYYVG